ncbi:MAG: protein FAM161B, partial [archaeon]|nr:protein FAM161B [archaeon]
MEIPVYRTIIKEIPTPIPKSPHLSYVPQTVYSISKQDNYLKSSSQPRMNEHTPYTGEPNAGHNPTVSNYIFHPSLTELRPPKNKTKMEFAEPIVDESTIYNEKEGKNSEAFINKMESELENLKKQNEKNKNKRKLKSGKNKPTEESKQILENTDENYISLDEIQKRKEEILKGLKDTQEEFYAKKEKDKEQLKNYLALNGGLEDMGRTEELMSGKGNTEVTFENAKQSILDKPLTSKKKIKQRTTVPIQRKGYNNDKPVELKDEKFIKRFAKYLLMKRIQAQLLRDNFDEEQIKDLCQTNISEETQSMFFTGSVTKGLKSRQGQSNFGETCSYMQSEFKINNNNLQSFVAFSKMIFALIDKNKSKIVSKEDVIQGIALDNQILQDLGFESSDNFIMLISIYEPLQSQKKDELTESDFIMFLLSKTDFKDEVYNLLYKQQNTAGNVGTVPMKRIRRRKKGKNGELEEVDISDDSDADLPGLRTHVFDFLELTDIYEKLDKVNQILESTKQYNLKYNNQSSVSGYKSNAPVKMRLKLTNEKIKISYQEYLTFIRSFHRKNEINFTIPEPFEFLRRDYMKHKLEKIREILMEQVKYIEDNRGEPFRANKLKEGIWGNQMENIIEKEKKERMKRQERIKERIVAEMKPFSFYDEDERKYIEKLKSECQPPVFPPFRAGAIKWLSQVNIYEDMITKGEEERKKRIQERMEKMQKASKLPPRMEASIQELKRKQEEEKSGKPKEKKEKYVFKANEVPDFPTLQKEFEDKLESMKKSHQPTVPIPFTMHEPKKKPELYPVDFENNPNDKNPQKKTDIKNIVKRMKKKPSVEPSTTKGLNLLMDARRAYLENREKEIKRVKKEDEEREQKYKEAAKRVHQALRENENERQQKEGRKQSPSGNPIKDEMKRTELAYRLEMERRMKRVQNKPLLLQQPTGKYVPNEEENEIEEEYKEEEGNEEQGEEEGESKALGQVLEVEEKITEKKQEQTENPEALEEEGKINIVGEKGKEDNLNLDYEENEDAIKQMKETPNENIPNTELNNAMLDYGEDDGQMNNDNMDDGRNELDECEYELEDKNQ